MGHHLGKGEAKAVARCRATAQSRGNSAFTRFANQVPMAPDNKDVFLIRCTCWLWVSGFLVTCVAALKAMLNKEPSSEIQFLQQTAHVGLQNFCSGSACTGQRATRAGSPQGAPERGHTKTGPSTEGSKCVERILQPSQKENTVASSLGCVTSKTWGTVCAEDWRKQPSSRNH